MKVLKIILILLLVGFIGMQFFGGTKPVVKTENPEDLLIQYELDGDIEGLLRRACYDCHSMETKYPWYGNVAPVSWFLFDHIRDGREELNFSEWGTLEKRTKIRKLKELIEEVEEGKMPLESYVSMHEEAKLTENEKKKLVTWAKSFSLKTLKE